MHLVEEINAVQELTLLVTRPRLLVLFKVLLLEIAQLSHGPPPRFVAFRKLEARGRRGIGDMGGLCYFRSSRCRRWWHGSRGRLGRVWWCICCGRIAWRGFRRNRSDLWLSLRRGSRLSLWFGHWLGRSAPHFLPLSSHRIADLRWVSLQETVGFDLRPWGRKWYRYLNGDVVCWCGWFWVWVGFGGWGGQGSASGPNST